MKKKYEKPQAMIESFELSQHIAACTEPVKNVVGSLHKMDR